MNFPARYTVPGTILALALLGFMGLTFVAGCANETEQVDSTVMVAISYPAPGAFVNKKRFKVQGSASGVSQVEVNGQRAEVTSGKWEVLVDFAEGAATATATARGTTASVDFVVDTIAPKIVLDAPARGLFVAEADGDQVVFRGQVVEESSGLKVLGLDGAGVQFDADGRFTHTARLQPGYNEFELKAIDHAGNASRTLRAVVFGPLVDPAAEIDSAAEIQLDADTLETASQVIVGLLTPERVGEFVQVALADNQSITVEGVAFDQPAVSIVPRSADALHDDGYLQVKIHVENLEVSGSASLSGEVYPATIKVDELTVSTEVLLGASSAGGLDISMQNTELALQEEALHFDVAGVSEAELGDGLRNLLRTMATSVARAAFSDLLGDELFDALYDPGMLRRQVELLGRRLEFQFYVRKVRVTQAGVFVRAALAVLTPRFEDIPQVPGALDLPLGERTPATLSADMLFTTHRTAVNRILHGAWHSGLLNQRLVGDDFAGFQLPVALNAGALSLLLGREIGDLAPGNTPAGMRLRPQLPPLVSLSSERSAADANKIRLHLGELLADLELLPKDGAPIAIATVALFVDINAQFEVRDGQLALALDAKVRANVDQKPTVELDDQKVEGLFEDLTKLATQLIGNKLQLGAEADLGWLKIEDVRAEVHGEDDDQLTLGAQLSAQP